VYFLKEQRKLIEFNKVVNWHEHVRDNNRGQLDEEQCDFLVEAAKRAYMDVLVVSRPISGGSPTPEMFRANNNVVAAAIKR
jgi:hypothetical protein